MLCKRVIARLDVRSPNLIKTRNLEGVRIVGDPAVYAARYDAEGIDEILFMDVVASLYGRNNLVDLISYVARGVFCPLTVGGGVKSVEDAVVLLRSGADKIALNTEATKRPKLLTEIAMKLGSQAVVIQIDAKKNCGRWEALCDGGREPTGRDAVKWAVEACEMGAGEVLITSIDREGTRLGFDLDLIGEVSRAVRVPVIASGGMGSPQDAVHAISAGADAVSAAHILHYGDHTVSDIKNEMAVENIAVRIEIPA